MKIKGLNNAVPEKFLLKKEMFDGQEFNSVMASVTGRRLWVTYRDGNSYFKVEDLKTSEIVMRTFDIDRAIKKFNDM